VRSLSSSRSAGLPVYADFWKSDHDEDEVVTDGVVLECVTRRRRAPRTIGERIDSCGQTAVIVTETVEYGLSADGEVLSTRKKRSFHREVACDLRAVGRLGKRRGGVLEEVPEIEVLEWVEDQLLDIKDVIEVERDETGEVIDAWHELKETYSYRIGTSKRIGMRALYISDELASLLPGRKQKNGSESRLAAHSGTPSSCQAGRLVSGRDSSPLGRATGDGSKSDDATAAAGLPLWDDDRRLRVELVCGGI